MTECCAQKYKSKLGAMPGPDNKRTNIYTLKKNTYENAGFCMLCIDQFNALKFSNKLSSDASLISNQGVIRFKWVKL